jgi:N-acylglucosamine-6-phosphate 2-epimerase
LEHQLIVSVQAEPPEPLSGVEHLAAMAASVVLGGAAGVRTNRPEVVKRVKEALPHVPLIGLWKKQYEDSPIYITPCLADCMAVAEAGADIVALDATQRSRPHAETLAGLVAGFRQRSDRLLMADIAAFDDALLAVELGFDLISTTLSGYTTESFQEPSAEPDFPLLRRLCETMGSRIPVVAEGRISTPQQARMALGMGAFAVVVGTAITRPHVLTRRFADAMAGHKKQADHGE